MRVLAWHVHGSWMTSFVQGPHDYVVPLDDERQWWRYHHLFAEALRARLTADGTDGVGRLHQQAARWYAEHDRLPDAVRHALAGGDVAQAADLVELAVPGMREAIDRLFASLIPHFLEPLANDGIGGNRHAQTLPDAARRGTPFRR